MTEINKADKVRATLLKMLFEPEEIVDGKPPENAIVVDGIMTKYAFHPGRTEACKEDIRWLLNEMPDAFQLKKGGGWSFLNLCMDKHDVHWAEHPTMESLVCLGIAAGMASFPMPREYWKMLPGGMPYVVFDT